MNLLAHCYLADYSRTSHAGQILGDMVKGPLTGRYAHAIETGIRLHRRIDACSDAHAAHRDLRNRFEPPLRRYAGILVDIGFDHSLARHWPDFCDVALAQYARHAEHRVILEWPIDAPLARSRMAGLAAVLAGYRESAGVQRALDSVARRLRRRNPLREALPAIMSATRAFDAALPELLADLQRRVCEQLADDRVTPIDHY